MTKSKNKYRGERVLVFERSLLDEMGSFQGVEKDTSKYLDTILNKTNNKFALRCQAEQDESLKQIIPYVVFYHDDKVFSYVRGKQAGETRLVGNRSIGIGGHINPPDDMVCGSAGMARGQPMYRQAVKREIEEEVIISEPCTPSTVGLINDDSNPVGRVHFGIVHTCRLSGESVRKREQQITQSGFVSIEELAGPRRGELEAWSVLSIDLLQSIIEKHEGAME